MICAVTEATKSSRGDVFICFVRKSTADLWIVHRAVVSVQFTRFSMSLSCMTLLVRVSPKSLTSSVRRNVAFVILSM